MFYTYNSTKIINKIIVMMIFLTALVFIAQIVIVINLLTFLIKTDRRVCVAEKQLSKKRVKLKWRMGALVEISEGMNEIIPIMKRKAERTKINFLIRILNEAAQGTILLAFRPKYKKMLIGVKTGIGVARHLLKI